MAFDIQTLVEASRCAECASPNQKQNVLLYLLNGILENGGSGGTVLHNLLSLTHPDTVPGPPLRGSLIVGNATPDWEALLIGAAGTFMGSNGTDAAWTAFPGGFTGFANPTALVGLVAVNGVATTAMRSDAAPALDQGIVPTWTGAHTWTPPANTTPITVSGYSLTGANAQSLLNLSGTWNTSGVPTALLLNITQTAVGSAALLMDLQRDSISRFRISRTGFATFTRQEADVSSGGIAMNKRGTTGDATAAIASASSITGIEFNGWDGVAYGLGANIRAIATETWTGAGHGTSLVFSMTANGSTATPIKFTLTSTAFAFSPHGVAAGNTSELRFLELAAGGVNYTGFKAADAMAASEIYVLPDAAPAANRFLRAGAVAAGASTLSWAQVSLTADVAGILPVANGGSGTSTAFTAGSVVFAGAAGVYTEDNANFFWDNTNNWLGLGIAVPLARLHVVSSAAATIVEIIKAAAAQSANMTEWQSSAGVVNTVINSMGNINIPTTTASAGIILQATLRFIHSFGGTTNFFAGINAGNLSITGTNNTGIGNLALQATTSGSSNAAIGAQALFSLTQGANNVAVGVAALGSVTTGASNFGLGTSALASLVSGSNNIGIGVQALALCTGANNIAFGHQVADNLTTGSSNILIGYALDAQSVSQSNVLVIGNLIFGAGVDGMGTTFSSGGVGIRVVTPTAKLHLCAGTTAASTAPLKFNTGTSMTAAEAGAVEFTTDDLFFTITTGAARKRLLMADATAGLTSGKMPIATTNGRLIDLTASSAYAPTNVTADRAYDANATSLDELSDVVGSMISDLQAKGILG